MVYIKIISIYFFVSSMVLVILLYALFGFTFTLGKMVVMYASPLFAIGIRMITGGGILALYIALSKSIRCYPRKSDIPLYIQMTLFVTLLPYTLRLWALQYVSTTKASLLFNTGPLFTAIFSYFLCKERMTWRQVVGLILGFVGMLPILLTGSRIEDALGSWWFISLPELAVIGAICSLSYGLIIMRRLVKDRGCPPYLANGISMLAGGIVALSLSGLSSEPALRGSLTTLCIVLGLQVLISNLFCSNLQAYLLKTYSPTFISLASFLGPIFTSFYGYLFFGEMVTWQFFASFILVLAGLAIYSLSPHETCTPENR